MPTNNKYDLVAQNPHSTVVAEYTPEYGAREKRTEQYQSEAELEQAFIEQLELQAYGYLAVTSEEGLKQNLRKQLEKLNDYTFSDSEWEQFFVGELANPNQSIFEKTTRICPNILLGKIGKNCLIVKILMRHGKSIKNNE